MAFSARVSRHDICEPCSSIEAAELRRRADDLDAEIERSRTAIEAARPPRCQAEDMGGWPACNNDATLQTKVALGDGKRRFYCGDHRVNRHVWSPEELEPIAR